MVEFRLRSKPGLGVASATVTASSGSEKASQKIELDVRSSTARVTDVLGGTIKPGEAWTPTVALPGLAGTNLATLEVSRVPPLDLGRRLEYLIAYPHGCLEQTVSAAFPQLYLGKLLELTPDRKARSETNVKAALEKLRRFQATNGGFGYWPGDDDSNDWATSYGGHFAIEAQKAGYLPPVGLLDQWTGFQRRRARAWVAGEGQAELTQAYRLFTLALAGAPELPAMNQLRERPSLPVAAKWRLAAAYQLAGQPEAARALASAGPPPGRSRTGSSAARSAPSSGTRRWCSRRSCCSAFPSTSVRSRRASPSRSRRTSGSRRTRRPTLCSRCRRP